MEAKHTPGPWLFDDHAGCRTIKGGKSSGRRQAQYTGIAHTVGLHDQDTDKANARLIAAAPEMKAMLHRLADEVVVRTLSGIETPGLVAEARALLAKIEG